MSNLFSKENMRRFKQGFLESIGVADNTREEDKEFELTVRRFNAAATGVGSIHAKLKDYIRTQEELSLSSAAVYTSLANLTTTIPTGPSPLEVTAQLKTCATAQELHTQTVFGPSKKYFQRTVLRPCEMMAKKVTIIAALVTKCRGLYVDVDAFKHKFSSQKKKDPAETQAKTLQFRRRLQDFTSELSSCKTQLFAMVDRFEAEAKLLVEHLVSAFVAYQVHTSTRTGDLLQVVGERTPNAGAHMVELGCLTGRARGASVLVPDAEKPRPSLKLREYLQALLSSRPRALAPAVKQPYPAQLPFSSEMSFDQVHGAVRPPTIPASAAEQHQSPRHQQEAAARAAAGGSTSLKQAASNGSPSSATGPKASKSSKSKEVWTSVMFFGFAFTYILCLFFHHNFVGSPHRFLGFSTCVRLRLCT
eukprot:INCI7692.2.p1 GENE.INCI7692.2~~INCI7692.2.p1  ORF type:complete len:419 (+),score=75.00 INCI7692.2:219-1475(+)